METHVIHISILLPTLLMLVFCVASVINYINHKRWYNLLQASGALCMIFPNGIRFVCPVIVPSIGTNILNISLYLGTVFFLVGYAIMAITKNKDITIASCNQPTASLLADT